jgi:hypothetical protein
MSASLDSLRWPRAAYYQDWRNQFLKPKRFFLITVFIALEAKGTETRIAQLLKENRAKSFTSTRALLNIKSVGKARSDTNGEAHHQDKQRHQKSSIVLTVGRLRLHCNSTKITPIKSHRSHLPRACSPTSTTPEREDITEGRRHVPLWY